MHTIAFRFDSEDQAAAWFVCARTLGAVPEGLGLASSGVNQDRAFGVTDTRPVGGRWVVEPLTRECSCGHDQGDHQDAEGACERCDCERCFPLTVTQQRNRRGTEDLVRFGNALARDGALADG